MAIHSCELVIRSRGNAFIRMGAFLHWRTADALLRCAYECDVNCCLYSNVVALSGTVDLLDCLGPLYRDHVGDSLVSWHATGRINGHDVGDLFGQWRLWVVKMVERSNGFRG